MKRKYIKRIVNIILSAAVAVLPFSISSKGRKPPYSVNGNTVSLPIARNEDIPPHILNVSAISDKIFRITAIPDGGGSIKPSLCVANSFPQGKIKVEHTDSTISVITLSAIATISISDGRVWFSDSNGKMILTESQHGRKFSPIVVDGTKGFTVSQGFDSSSENEGIYGLGQHQSNEINYKGRNEQLFQYNTKVSVPFVVSTGNYGILWDSYSLCRFGNKDDYSQLGDVFKLYDKYGVPGSLTGTYIPSKSGGKLLETRHDSIYFEHLQRGDLGHVVNLPRDFRFTGSNVVYEGEIEPLKDGLHEFILYYSGYQKVMMGDSVVVPERWRTSWNPNSYKFQVNLKKGVRMPVKIEWKPDGDVAYCGLRAYPPRSADERSGMSWWGEMQDGIDYYFIYGDNMDEVISGYRTLTGKAPVMPRWAMGYWQSREKYNTQEELLSTLTEFRKRDLPIDNIVLDWLHWPQDSWGSHEFDKKRFPDPKQMIDSVHSMNGHIMVSVWPKFYTTTDHYKEFDQNGWMYQLAVKDSIKDWVGKGYLGSFYDAYSPEARKLFWSQVNDHYVPLGVDAWWMDASEPNIRDCTDIQYRKDLMTPTALGSSTKYFNAYSLMNADAIYNGQRNTCPDKRVFLLTRSGFSGQQRFSTATWSGDIATRWEDMRAQISAGINFSMSGLPWWTMDIGGFCVERRYEQAQKEFDKTGVENEDLKEWRELNARWFQFGAFVPLFRSHGQFPRREPFNIAPEDHPAYESMSYYLNLRYSLMPYIYSLAGKIYLDDYTLMRGMAMDFPKDLNTRNLKDQYMFGPAFLVAPVAEYGARERAVYMPKGDTWYDFYTGKKISDGGETVKVDAPYGRMPLFVRGGSIVPVGEKIQYASEKPGGPIKLYVYAGRDGDFAIYEDENENYNYEKGYYSVIPVKYDDSKRCVTIGNRDGSFPGMINNRRFEVVLVDDKNPVGYDGCISGKIIEYSGNQMDVKF